MQHRMTMIALLALPLVLAACGGGGGGGDAPSAPVSNTSTTPVTPVTPPAPPPSSGDFTGSVSKLLDTNGLRGGMFSKGLSLVANATDLVQVANGAVTRFPVNSLAGSYGVKEMHGDQWYAVGRWNKGTATVGFNKDVTLSDANAAHYFIYHPAASSYGNTLAGAKLSCADMHTTKPSSDSTITSASLSQVMLAIKTDGQVDLDFTVTADGSAGKIVKRYAGTALWTGTAYAPANLGLDGGSPDLKNGSLLVGAHEANHILLGGMFSLNGHPAVYSVLCKVTA